MDALSAAVRRAAEAVVDPELGRTLGDLEMLRSVEVNDTFARVEVALTISTCPMVDRIVADVESSVFGVSGIERVQVDVTVMDAAERLALTERLRGGGRKMPFTKESLTRVILVTSGKGGVGKSTITANLAVALVNEGLSVGVIDADVHGFSIPGLLGLEPECRPTQIDDLIVAPEAHGVKLISIGMFLPPGQDVVAWRGPMLHRTLEQFLTDTHFGDVDVVLVDMPPGTGDVAISIGQLLPHAEVLVVTTPQPAAAGVAIRSGRVAQQLGQRVMGVVENMAGWTLPDGSSVDLFGTGGGKNVATVLTETSGAEVPVLASIPISEQLRISGDTGQSLLVTEVTDAAAQAILALARTVASQGRGLAGRRLPLQLSTSPRHS